MATDKITDTQILRFDFYDFLGSMAVFYTNEEKVRHYRELIKQQTGAVGPGLKKGQNHYAIILYSR